MYTGKSLVKGLELRLARTLAARPAGPMILAGTLAVAGLGAATLNPIQAHRAPSSVSTTPTLDLSSPHTFCYSDPDGDGHYVCHILASQVNTIPNLGCTADSDGDGTYICWYATDPRSSN
jgi:hypothetical protein